MSTTTSSASTSIAVAEPLFSPQERLALAGFLAGRPEPNRAPPDKMTFISGDRCATNPAQRRGTVLNPAQSFTFGHRRPSLAYAREPPFGAVAASMPRSAPAA